MKPAVPSASDMGRVLVTFRSWPARTPSIVFGVLVVGPLVTIAIVGGPTSEIVLRAGLVCFMALGLSPLFLSGVLEKHRVCEHGLVVGFRKNSRYVIPWSSVDPGRVRILRRLLWFSHYTGDPTRTECNRVSQFTAQAVLVNGGHPDLGRSTFPFTWWVLGVPRAEALVEAIEKAMVADGFPAHGLADRAARQAITPVRRKAEQPVLPHRHRSDPELGVHGPLMNP